MRKIDELGIKNNRGNLIFYFWCADDDYQAPQMAVFTSSG